MRERPKSSQGMQTDKINPRNSAQSMSNIYNYKDSENPMSTRKQSRNIEERIQMSKSRIEELNSRLHNEGKEKEARQSLARLKHWTKDMQAKP